MNPAFSGPPVARLRSALLGIFLLAVAGTATELLLLGHTEDTWQLVPLGLFGASLLLLGWHALAPGATPVRAFQGLMAAFLAAGATGILLHYRGNVEFELEMYPDRTGWELFAEAMTGAFPALAPGTMAQLGLLGLLWTYRHPALTRSTTKPPPEP